MFDGPATSIPHDQGRQAQGLRGQRRRSATAALPDVPTFAEQGYPGIDDVAMDGLWTRPDVPADVQKKVRDTALKVLAQPASKQRLLELGFDQGSGATPEQLTQSLRKAYDKQGETLRALGVKPQDLGG